MSASVIYHFYAAKGEETLIALHFDPRTYRLQLPTDPVLPEWAKLNFNRCPNCTLADSEEYCPAAAALAQFLPCFESRFSYEKTTLQVETGNRTIVAQTTFQHGIAGVIGLAMATSGCPRTLFLRPMARTHLPLATEEETVFRSLAIHLLSQYVAQSGSGGAPVSLSLQRLKEDYGHLSHVNAAMAERIRTAIERDAAVNAVIILDSFAMITPENIDTGFEDIRALFVVEEGVGV